MDTVREHCSFQKKKFDFFLNLNKIKSNQMRQNVGKIKILENNFFFVDQNDLFKMKICLALLINARTWYLNCIFMYE